MGNYDNYNEKSQYGRILRYLKTFGTISPLEAFKDLGITKLATRISEMRKLGYEFDGILEKTKNRYNEDCSYMRYCLIKEPTNVEFIANREKQNLLKRLSGGKNGN